MNLRFPALLLTLLLAVFPARAEEMAGPPVTLYIARSGLTTGTGSEPTPVLQRWRQLLSSASGVPLEYSVGEFAENYAKAIASRDSCMAGLIRSPDREADLDWITAFIKDRAILIARRDDTFSGTLEQAAAAGRIVGPAGPLSERLGLRGLKMDLVQDHVMAVRQVTSGSFRFALTSFSNLNGMPQEMPSLRIVLSIEPIDYWFACSRRLPADQRERLQSGLQLLNKSPEMQQIIREMNGTALSTPD
jgi:hypothetical protein